MQCDTSAKVGFGNTVVMRLETEFTQHDEDVSNVWTDVWVSNSWRKIYFITHAHVDPQNKYVYSIDCLITRHCVLSITTPHILVGFYRCWNRVHLTRNTCTSWKGMRMLALFTSFWILKDFVNSEWACWKQYFYSTVITLWLRMMDINCHIDNMKKHVVR